jgi:hypothetical protein
MKVFNGAVSYKEAHVVRARMTEKKFGERHLYNGIPETLVLPVLLLYGNFLLDIAYDRKSTFSS